MPEKPPPPPPPPPPHYSNERRERKSKPTEVINLTGENFNSYQAGLHYGFAIAFTDASKHFERIEKHQRDQLIMMRDTLLQAVPQTHRLHALISDIPSLSVGLKAASQQFYDKAEEHRKAGAKRVSLLSGHLQEVEKPSRISKVIAVVVALAAMVAGALTYALVTWEW